MQTKSGALTPPVSTPNQVDWKLLDQAYSLQRQVDRTERQLVSMSYWNSHREIQRLIETFKPFEEQLRVYREAQEALATFAASMMPARDLLAQFEESWKLTTVAADILATSALLKAAIQPLPDFSAFAQSLSISVTQMAQLAQRISSAFEGAGFLAEIELPPEESESDTSEVDVAHQAETRLVKVVHAEALDELRRVEFAPLVLLDQALRDPSLMHRIGSRDFEGFVAALIDQLGFEDVVLTPRSGDHGRDVLATKRVHGIAIMCAFECKHYAPDRPVGPDIARALLGTITHPTTRVAKGILVTTSRFTAAAHRFIITEPTLDGKDFDGIVGWLHEYGSSRMRRPT